MTVYDANWLGIMTKNSPMIVAVDGPAASGKSSLCKRACALESWTHVSTGVLYRGLAWACLHDKVPLIDCEALRQKIDEFIEHLDWQFRFDRIAYKGRDLSGDLESNHVSKAASQIAELQIVRQKLKPLQRDVIKNQSHGIFLIDGRDIGTVIFPDADLKVFLTANLDIRATRRLGQLQNKATEADEKLLEGVKKTIAERDYYDTHRTFAPLKRADDAVELDTSLLNFDESVVALIDLVKAKLRV